MFKMQLRASKHASVITNKSAQSALWAQKLSESRLFCSLFAWENLEVATKHHSKKPGDRSAGLAPTGHTHYPTIPFDATRNRHTTKRRWLPNTTVTVQQRSSIVTTTATGANTPTHQLTRFPRTAQSLRVQDVTDKDSRLRV